MTLDEFDVADNVAAIGQLEREHKAKASKGVQRFLDSMRHVGEDDPLNGPRPVIPGIIFEGQTAMCPGAPGTGKSFVLIDWLARISEGLDFLGQPVLKGGAVYVAGEGQGGLSKRFERLILELGVTADAPFLYMQTMPRLLDMQEVKDFIEAIKRRTATWQTPIRLMAFDTFNKAIVGGSENDGKDVGRLLDADKAIKDAFGCASMFAHHPGKADGNDSRGHSSLLGDNEVTCKFSGDAGTRTIEIKKQKDGESGAVFGYSLRQITIGQHKVTGLPVTTCAVDWVASDVVQSLKTGKSSWPKSLNLLCDVLSLATLEAGFDHWPAGDGPLVRAVPLERVRALHRTRYVSSGDGDRDEAERKAFRRSLKAAQDNRLIAGEASGGRELLWSVAAK